MDSNFKPFAQTHTVRIDMDTNTLTVERMLITPEIATKFLERNISNRNIRQRLVEHYAATMERGDWKENAETIKFDINNNLIDGQHRLWAIIESNCPQYIFVARNVNTEAYSTIDIGAKKNNADFFRKEGETNTVRLSAGLVQLWNYRVFGDFLDHRQRPTFEQLEQLLTEEPNFRIAISEMERIHNDIHGITPSVLSVLIHLFAEFNYDDMSTFFEKFRSGFGFESEDDPIYVLYKRFHNFEFISQKSRSANNIHAALIVKAWNAFREGKKIRQLRWQTSGQNKEEFPIPV